MVTKLVVTDRGIGRWEGEEVRLLDTGFTDLGSALEQGVSLVELAEAPVIGVIPFAEAALRPPVARPPHIWAVGLNYRAHVDEIKGMDLTEPFIFLKAGGAVIGPEEPIVLPVADGHEVDFEGELALIVGRRAHRVAAEDAWDCVAGVTICNDVSARSLQKGAPGIRPNISLAKSFHSFAPLGPAVALLSGAGDVSDLALRTEVNGEVRQEARTSQLIFPIPRLIEYLSARVTLLPGDIIATGTPEGVGDVDGRYLAPGDVIEIHLEHVGTLKNPVVPAADLDR